MNGCTLSRDSKPTAYTPNGQMSTYAYQLFILMYVESSLNHILLVQPVTIQWISPH